MDTDTTAQSVLQRVFRLPSLHLDAAERSPAVWAAILSGAGLGLVWGLAARTWMRLIATNPEFTLSGTATILVITIVFGAFVGLTVAARRRGWRRWGHYVPRGLVVACFLPFGIAGGAPLMVTVLVATLAVTRTALVGLWVLAVLAILVVVGTDIGLPAMVAVIVSAGTVTLTAWKWIAPRWPDAPRVRLVDTWLERTGRTLLLLLAAAGVVFVAWPIVTDTPALLATVYIVLYLLLLYPLFLALRVGLEPKASAP